MRPAFILASYQRYPSKNNYVRGFPEQVLIFTTKNIYAVETHNSVKENFVL